MPRVLPLCFALAFVSCFTLDAQPLQVKAGFNLSTVRGTYNEINLEMRPGFYLGVAKEFKILDWIAFQPSMIYSMQGYKLLAVQSRYDYLLMPMNFKFGTSRMGIMLGPQVGVLLNSTTILDGNSTRPTRRQVATPGVNLVNASAGVGPFFKVNDRIAIELRGVFDITNIDPNKRSHRVYNLVYQGGVVWAINKPSGE